MMVRFVLSLTLFFAFFTARAEQHPICSKPDVDHFSIPVEHLFAIAGTCELPAIAALFYKRASLRELMDEYQAFHALISNGRSGEAYFEAYRIFIGLVETFASESLSRGDVTIISRLNDTYDHCIEIAELRLKGYDLIANRMERELQR